MKIKQATQLAVIGVCLMIIVTIIYFLTNRGIITYVNPLNYKPYWYFTIIDIIRIIGWGFILVFFLLLAKNQK